MNTKLEKPSNEDIDEEEYEDNDTLCGDISIESDLSTTTPIKININNIINKCLNITITSKK
jgi:hypothetical protein